MALLDTKIISDFKTIPLTFHTIISSSLKNTPHFILISKNMYVIPATVVVPITQHWG
jgi:hypothetical protein